jgi:hypothetical protein
LTPMSLASVLAVASGVSSSGVYAMPDAPARPAPGERPGLMEQPPAEAQDRARTPAVCENAARAFASPWRPTARERSPRCPAKERAC